MTVGRASEAGRHELRDLRALWEVLEYIVSDGRGTYKGPEAGFHRNKVLVNESNRAGAQFEAAGRVRRDGECYSYSKDDKQRIMRMSSMIRTIEVKENGRQSRAIRRSSGKFTRRDT